MHKSRNEMTGAIDIADAKWRTEDWGDMHVSFEVYDREWNDQEMLRGLPGNECRCPHWGYVLAGGLHVTYHDREESIRAGEAYYLAPGHFIRADAGTELIEFSPRDDFAELMSAFEEKEAKSRQAAGISDGAGAR